MDILLNILLIVEIVWFIFICCVFSYRLGEQNGRRKALTVLSQIQGVLDEVGKRVQEEKKQNEQKGAETH